MVWWTQPSTAANRRHKVMQHIIWNFDPRSQDKPLVYMMTEEPGHGQDLLKLSNVKINSPNLRYWNMSYVSGCTNYFVNLIS